jgi:hypothetical protein
MRTEIGDAEHHENKHECTELLPRPRDVGKSASHRSKLRPMPGYCKCANLNSHGGDLIRSDAAQAER